MATAFNYSDWTGVEIERARRTAKQFMCANKAEIQGALAAQCQVLLQLIADMAAPELAFEDQLDCLAHITEVSQLLHDSAEGFFELGSHPVVAQTLLAG